jgi:integrase
MVQMTTLSKATNGDWFARKAIPADVREAYQAAYKVRREERFRRSSSLPQGHAKADFRDWDAEITSRIEALRAKAADSEIRLTPRQISALAGQWYAWFVDRHSDEPGEPEDWDARDQMLTAVYDRFNIGFPGDNRETIGAAAKRHIHAKLVEMGKVETFLAGHTQKLDGDTRSAFLDVLELELPAAFGLLRRRAGGDFSPDERLPRFALASAHTPTRGQKLAGLDCWQAFEAWVKERQPAPATVDRWRSVFLRLNTHFDRRDVATITADDAVKWKDTLVTEKRSGQVANDIWITAAVTIFNWLKENRKISENPFAGVRVATAKKVKRRERAFTDEEWKRILAASLEPATGRLKAQKAAARRWVPWLCAYTGSRPGEMTQLRGTSVRREGAIWIIDITPEDGTVKGASYRKVPIHEHLIEMGFLEFARSAGEGPLFYDPKEKRAASDDPTKPVREPYVIARNKLAEWVRNSVKIVDPDISPNHAWRHTFKRMAARHGMEKRFRFAFCGHESDDVGDIYETPTLEDMAEELKKFPRYVLDGDSVDPDEDETA